MADIQTANKWTFTSTGTGKAHDCKGYAQGITIGVETSTQSTAVTQVLHRMGSSAGPYSILSTIVSTLGEFTTDQFMGPLEWVTLRVVSKTAGGSTNTVTGYLIGN